MADTSAVSNTVQLVGTWNGEVIIPIYDWNEHFTGYCKKLMVLKNTILNSLSPGVVKAKKRHDDTTEEFHLLMKTKWNPTKNYLPSLVTPTGLRNKRQWYLHDKIRPYCSDETKDLVCPLPSTERDANAAGQEDLMHPPSRSLEPPPRNKTRACGNCGMHGHNNHSAQTNLDYIKLFLVLCILKNRATM